MRGEELLRLLVALSVGAASLWLLSPIAAVVMGWYSFESLGYLMALRLRGHERRAVLVVYLGPRVVSTLVALAVAGLTRSLPVAYMSLLALEGAYRLALRWRARELAITAQKALTGDRERAEPRFTLLRSIVGACVAVLLVALMLVAFLGYAVREVLLAPHFYLNLVGNEQVYNDLVGVVGEMAVKIARSRGPEERRAVALLSEQDVEQAAQLLMPREWTVAVLDRVLVATVAWLRADDEQHVPSFSLPIRDLWRHARDATSLLLDRHMAGLPTCTPDMPDDAYCRPEEMSVVAYVATYKPANLARVDDIFALLPAEVDLATAVTLAPRQLGSLVDMLGKARQRVHAADRVLRWAGIGCLVAWAVLSLVVAYSLRAAARWVGVSLLVAGGLTWVMGWVLVAVVPRLVVGQCESRLLGELPMALTSVALVTFAERVRELIVLPALVVSGVGLTLIAVSWLFPSAAARAGEHVACAMVVAVTVGSVLWGLYLDVGSKWYAQARRDASRGNLESACRGYRRLTVWYPFYVGDFVAGARYRSRECRRYREAEAAYLGGRCATAARGYEALLVGDVPFAMRRVAEEHLRDSLYRWAASLEKAGERERALDRYRFIRDEFDDSRVEDEIATLYYRWGEELEAKGDYEAAVATYRRVAADVVDYRLWRKADERAVAAYCAWANALLADGQGARAAQVCADLHSAFPRADLSSCGGCASR